ncbi:MAG: DUF3619 family protein [Methylophilaceae bacterium]
MNVDNTNQEINETLDLQAKQIASLLDAHANRLSMRTLKQLENGRARAIKAHGQQSTGETLNTDGTLSRMTTWVANHRLAMTGLVLATIISSYVVLKSFNNNESSDAFLLSAELPPEAFVDKGFEPSLNVQNTHLEQKN